MTAFLAGARPSAAAFAAIMRIVRKTGDETLNNNATIQDDDHLFIDLLANSAYAFHLHAIYLSNATPAFKIDWTLPAGTTMPSNTFMSGGTGASIQHGAYTGGLLTGIAGTGANAALDVWGIFKTGATAGQVKWRWAQDIANASNTIVRADSFLAVSLAG